MFTKCKVLGSHLLFYRGVWFEFDREETRDRYAQLLNSADQNQKYDLVRYYVKCILDETRGNSKNFSNVNKPRDSTETQCEGESIHVEANQKDDVVPFDVPLETEYRDSDLYVPE